MADQFQGDYPNLISPARDAAAIVPSPSALSQPTRALWIGTAGDVVVEMMGYNGNPGATVTLAGVQAGTVLPIRATKVLAATSAGGIVGLW